VRRLSTAAGTGFELAPRIVATVEHVVDGATAIRLKVGDRTVATASIIGADPAQDLALFADRRATERTGACAVSQRAAAR
jgi:S1-C subfamily serine protease